MTELKRALNNNRVLVDGVLISAIIFTCFGALLNAEFIVYDDGFYINDIVKGGLNRDSILWSLTSTSLGNWHPLTWLSHVLSVEIFGDWAGGHHLVNILLHLANSLLVYSLVFRLGCSANQSLTIALLFAVHPTHVESVAWIAERKDVLCLFFWLLGLHSFLRFRKSKHAAGKYQSFVYFIAGLMCKPMIVTYPFTLVLIDYWLAVKKRHSLNREWLRESLGLLWIYFPPILAISLLTLATQDASGAIAGHSFFSNLLSATANYLRYLVHFIYPTKLSVLYPYEETSFALAAASLVLICFLLTAVWRQRNRKPYILFGLSWYLITLFPVSGIVSIGTHLIADRYLYIPSIGLIFCAVLLIGSYLSSLRAVQGVIAGVTIAVFSLQTAAYVQTWENSASLFSYSIAHTGKNPVLEYNSGIYYRSVGEYEKAITHFSNYLIAGIQPQVAINELAIAYDLDGQTDIAIKLLKAGLHDYPDDPKMITNLRYLTNRESTPQPHMERSHGADRISGRADRAGQM